ncbi:Response regulator receiver domain-containing protein [Persephonella hydrogeniphila]|uniref:Response regulator receiver domain-containing protein n=1 Tax=Persephonella hydrogeniphila TaxID=198703 RepID=A0A285N3C6_9AQUI|nr:response regulator [Persephonella hydrogeniphila]SNZ02496.1 Response regulator receiver domain-containing protein [Persephonella hydrogeniphila]
MKIILLDEDKATYQVLKEVANLSGSEIIQITDIENAKEYLKENTDIDGIVAEQKLKGKPTWEIIQYMRENENIKEIPFIILSQSLTEDEKDFYRHIGVTAFFEKPFNPLEVFTAIVEQLKRTKGEEYVKSKLEEEQVDRNALKALINKLISFLKSLFTRR